MEFKFSDKFRHVLWYIFVLLTSSQRLYNQNTNVALDYFMTKLNTYTRWEFNFYVIWQKRKTESIFKIKDNNIHCHLQSHTQPWRHVQWWNCTQLSQTHQ